MTTLQKALAQAVGLLPCPFCGCEAIAENYVIEAAVRCTGCRAKVIRSHSAHEDTGYPAAITAWNNRTHGPEIEAAVRDAERYRLLRRKVCITGGQFHIINAAPTYVAPDAAVELDAVLDAMQADGGGS